jgi:dUTP pyrophosphatase
LVFAEYMQVNWQESEILSETERGAGGFGSTGVK